MARNLLNKLSVQDRLLGVLMDINADAVELVGDPSRILR